MDELQKELEWCAAHANEKGWLADLDERFDGLSIRERERLIGVYRQMEVLGYIDGLTLADNMVYAARLVR